MYYPVHCEMYNFTKQWIFCKFTSCRGPTALSLIIVKRYIVHLPSAMVAGYFGMLSVHC